jgi:uncharacterized protein YjbI with pentapeptide repeats
MIRSFRNAAIPDRRSLSPVDLDAIEDEPHLESAHIANITLSGDRLKNGLIERSIVEGVVFRDVDATSLIVRSAGFLRTDLSLGALSGASFSRCLFDGCKLTGTRLNRAAFKDVTFSECRSDFLQLQYARLQEVRFERCDLKQAYFNGARMKKTVFEACDLSGADFSQADISGSDLRRSRIEGIRVSPEQLKGVIVTHDQALYLAGLLGLVVRDD